MASLRPLLIVPLIAALTLSAIRQSLTFKTPPVKIPLTIKDQHVMITATALITMMRQEHGVNVLKLDLTADLANLQQNMTELLSMELDKNDRCGDHIAIQHATLTPQDPAALSTVQLHFERWTCKKLFGKEDATKLIAGSAEVRLKLTPVVESGNTKLGLAAELVSFDADGTLGQLLRAGPLGEMLRDKIKTAVQSALQKGSDLGAALPPSVQGYATIRNAHFRNAGLGRLEVLLTGEVQISDAQLQSLAKEVKGLGGRPR